MASAHGRRAAALDRDLGHLGAEAEAAPVAWRHARPGPGEPVHAAGDRHTPSARLRDQHQRRGRREGDEPHVGRVAAEELPQARIAELARRARRHSVANGRCAGDPADEAANGADQAEQARRRARMNGRSRVVEEAAGAVRRRRGKRLRLARGRRSRGSPRPAARSAKRSSGAAVGPAVTGEDGSADQRQVVVRARCRRAAKISSKTARMVKHGRAGVDAGRRARHAAQLAAGPRRALDDRDVEAAGAQAAAPPPGRRCPRRPPPLADARRTRPPASHKDC